MRAGSVGRRRSAQVHGARHAQSFADVEDAAKADGVREYNTDGSAHFAVAVSEHDLGCHSEGDTKLLVDPRRTCRREELFV